MVRSHILAIVDTTKLYLCPRLDFIVWIDGGFGVEDCKNEFIEYSSMCCCQDLVGNSLFPESTVGTGVFWIEILAFRTCRELLTSFDTWPDSILLLPDRSVGRISTNPILFVASVCNAVESVDL